jgi:hypothetical protein
MNVEPRVSGVSQAHVNGNGRGALGKPPFGKVGERLTLGGSI